MLWLEESSIELTQGSIIDGVDWGMGEANPLSIVITNACDFAHEKCSFINVLALESAKDVLQATREFKGYIQNANAVSGLTNKQWNSLSHYLESVIYNQNIIRYYFFDTQPVIDLGLVVADFQQVKSIPNEQGMYEIIGKMRSPFIEQLIMHYASYVSRIPSDRVDDEQRDGYINELAAPFHHTYFF